MSAYGEPHLEPPTTLAHDSYVAAITEFQAEGRHGDAATRPRCSAPGSRSRLGSASIPRW
jgi:hypothetical protein